MNLNEGVSYFLREDTTPIFRREIEACTADTLFRNYPLNMLIAQAKPEAVSNKHCRIVVA